MNAGAVATAAAVRDAQGVDVAVTFDQARLSLSAANGSSDGSSPAARAISRRAASKASGIRLSRERSEVSSP